MRDHELARERVEARRDDRERGGVGSIAEYRFRVRSGSRSVRRPPPRRIHRAVRVFVARADHPKPSAGPETERGDRWALDLG